MYRFFLLSVFVVFSIALEFGGMGGTSYGMGGSGVALRKSVWGLYYNPALLASDNRGKFGYSFGADLSQEGIGKLMALNYRTDGNPVDPSKIQEIYNSLSGQNALNISSQSGMVIQIDSGIKKEEIKVKKKTDKEKIVNEAENNESSKEDNANKEDLAKLGEDSSEFETIIVQKRANSGSFAVGSFVSLYSGASLSTSIEGTGVDVDAKYKIQSNNILLVEVPIGYGYRFESFIGDISVGVALKYMRAIGVGLKSVDSIKNGLHIEMPNFDSIKSDDSFSADFGIVYSPFSSLHIGLVGKNLTSPTFKFRDFDLNVKPQFRAGVSYEFLRFFVLSADVDIVKNQYASGLDSQIIGGGLLADFKYIDLRIGSSFDIANDSGLMLGGGVNILGFFDIAMQASLSGTDLRDFGINTDKRLIGTIPNKFGVKFGGSFTF